jgi:hypothetical protein
LEIQARTTYRYSKSASRLPPACFLVLIMDREFIYQTSAASKDKCGAIKIWMTPFHRT